MRRLPIFLYCIVSKYKTRSFLTKLNIEALDNNFVFFQCPKVRLEKMILEIKMIKTASEDEGRQTKSFIRRRIFDELLSLIQMPAIIECLHLSWSKTKQSGMNSYFTSTSRKKLHIFDPKSAIIECLSSPLPDSVEATKHLIQTAMNSFFSHLLHTWGKKLIWHHGKWCLLLFNHWFAHLLKR